MFVWLSIITYVYTVLLSCLNVIAWIERSWLMTYEINLYKMTTEMISVVKLMIKKLKFNLKKARIYR